MESRDGPHRDQDLVGEIDPEDPVERVDPVDPAVAELVVTIRDRFGLRGMRGAQAMLADEVVLAEKAMAALEPEDEPVVDS